MKYSLLLCVFVLSTYLGYAQSTADFNYSVGVKGYTIMQMPKILDQTNKQDYTHVYLNGGWFKFNDNQISYRFGGSYYRGNVQFDNTCATCEIAKGKVTDYNFKIGFEKIFNYANVQPYMAFDIGYRSNQYNGVMDSKNNPSMMTSKTVDASKTGGVLSPVIGVRINVIPQVALFGESSLDFFYSYEKQDISTANGTNRILNTYKKLETLLNPITVGIQFSFSEKN